MKKSKIWIGALIMSAFTFMMINSCEVLTPTYEEYELYGTWNIEDFSFDIKIDGDNFGQVFLARLLIATAKGEFEDELQQKIDSLGGSLVFNEDYTYNLVLFEESDTGTWMFNPDDNSISLSAEDATIDHLMIEKLTEDQLIISYFLDTDEFESDSTEAEISVEVNIEAVFSREY